MTPAAIIAGACADGIVLALAPDGGLTFKGPRRATDKWVPILRATKPAVVAHLNRAAPDSSPWDATDWHAYYDERAAILEYEGGLPRPEAEARAWECCIGEWLVHHAARSDPGRCHWCGDDGRTEPLLPYGTTVAGHVWMHGRCWPAWYASRKTDAAEALREIGVGRL